MGHIHSKAGQHDFTASAFIIRSDFKEPKIMLHKHKILGKYLQFGGHVELDETPWQTVVHELCEESGYDISQLKVLQPKNSLKKLTGSKVHPVPVVIDTHRFLQNSDHYHTDIKFVLITNEEPAHKPEIGESSAIEILSLKEVIALKNETLADIIEISKYIFKEVLVSWEMVDINNFSR